MLLLNRATCYENVAVWLIAARPIILNLDSRKIYDFHQAVSIPLNAHRALINRGRCRDGSIQES